ncbi:MAG TPA: CvpA family protein [Methylomirabilota bacterium]|jgi:uncharacterized membrane protein required for colicin V production|nr:CvpA family protein [Methylomirabilota bacterium]
MSLDSLPVGAFDIVLVAVLALGVFRGRKHGMSEELLNLIKWIVIIFGCAFIYEPVGRFFSQSSHVFSLFTCYLMAYVAGILLVLIIFAGVKRALGGKLIGSDIFGASEYYLGMGSGFVRFACMLIAALALLNARYFSPDEIRDRKNFQDDVYGSNFFPGLQSVQAMVFERSLCGPWIRDHLGFFLIKPTQPENKEIKQKEYQFP